MPGKPANTGIGAPVRRREDRRLLTGGGRYSDDLNLPGQAYAVMLRSPHAHALIRAIDTAAASAAPGVLAVLTGAELRADGLHPIPHAVWSQPPGRDRAARPRRRHHLRAAAPLHGRSRPRTRSATSLPSSSPAASPPPAMAPNAWRWTTSRCPRSTRALAAAAPGAPLAHADAPGNLCVDSARRRRSRDRRRLRPRRARRAARDLGAARHRRADGAARRDRRCIDRDSGKYTLHAGTGGAVRPRNDLAAVLGVPQDRCAHGDARRRRQFRHPRRVLSGIRPGGLGRAPRRPPGEVDRRRAARRS